MDERVFFHLSEVLPDNSSSNAASASGSGADNNSGVGVTEKAPETEGTPTTTNNANSSGSSSNKPTIKRGQEVAFRIGQRQGKPLGLRVRKLRAGTLPTEESLPCRFVGVVVVPPRNVGTTDKEKVSLWQLLCREILLLDGSCFPARLARSWFAITIDDNQIIVEARCYDQLSGR